MMGQQYKRKSMGIVRMDMRLFYTLLKEEAILGPEPAAENTQK
jgi:hypothetical protein